MATQTDITAAVNWVLRFADQQIAFPNGQYVGECTAPVVQMLTHLNYPIPYMANNRADGWGTSPPVELKPFYTTQAYQSGVTYPEGTLMMWDSPHIAVVISCDGSNNVKVFEQNADPNGSNCHIINRVVDNEYHHANFVMIPIIDNTPPPPPYTKENITPKQIVFNKDTHLWNLSLTTFDQVVANPTGDVVANPSSPITVDGIIHPTDPSLSQYSYYTNVEPFGYNTLDCNDYVPPPPVTLASYKPLVVKQSTKYTLLATVPVYGNWLDAANKKNSTGSLPADGYYVITTQNDMIDISANNAKDNNTWVNPGENVPPPVVVPVAPVVPVADTSWKGSFVSFNDDRSPVKYVLMAPYKFKDLSGYSKNEVIRNMYDEVDFSGVFEKDSIPYVRVYVADKGDPTKLDINRWFGIPSVNPATGLPYLEPSDQVYGTNTTTAERITLKHETPYDRVIKLGATVDKLYEKTIKSIDGIFKRKK